MEKSNVCDFLLLITWKSLARHHKSLDRVIHVPAPISSWMFSFCEILHIHVFWSLLWKFHKMPLFQFENKKGDASEQSDCGKVSAFKYALFKATSRFYAGVLCLNGSKSLVNSVAFGAICMILISHLCSQSLKKHHQCHLHSAVIHWHLLQFP